ncbi:LEAF RUST 10 DISEASE-RESISTANCE LOCUS RECEPTOR-LIKE PROTEIN KINASE-like 1.3 [Prunus yedoensis var. nudiflora]|uniref:LEAF RUST 10 DISEASE-RESISTANCE LOCUS RECEPTOR-LIKE PROTEIN KINASE-like 1.3 n=1 Tax=Prunus yedoensis var. nudiflora TaxID=2094558 RepID=A0A314Z6H3_PRUYE|nr:LEAF RUST 10 DISEASE-RESISTANCE LOCUS RECEPTOR-LIKE PROTEIN KINASE-like 1.3 [Prunus yedoensis var. nudiflora]
MHTLLLQSLFPLLLITSFLSINVELSLCQDNEQFTNCGEDIKCGGTMASASHTRFGEKTELITVVRQGSRLNA